MADVGLQTISDKVSDAVWRAYHSDITARLMALIARRAGVVMLEKEICASGRLTGEQCMHDGIPRSTYFWDGQPLLMVDGPYHETLKLEPINWRMEMVPRKLELKWLWNVFEPSS